MSLTMVRGAARAVMGAGTAAALALFAAAPGWIVGASAATEDTINVVVDQAKLIKLPENVATIVVGNPLIADVSLQAGGTVVVTGKGYGATNVIAVDRSGTVLIDRVIQVEGPADSSLVTVYRGLNRESYSCAPSCEKRVTLGDEKGYFAGALEQAGAISNQIGAK
ncbi:MAG TPA: pilus assembly protein N-terminal domain-containing protein [Xanthobacteraceae bacterium]|nr:pilus assembly protein N-terminal domain-containing protein [Xanthobacteraceae bacterium]